METTILTVNNVWMMICTALVFFMHLGFSFLEIGLTRKKNTVNILFKNFFVITIGLLMYTLGGFSLMYPGFEEGSSGFLKFAGFGITPPEGGMGFEYANGGYTWWTDFLFQGMFAATAATIVSGAVAGRIKLTSFMLFTVFYVGFIYPIVGSWKWGGGFLEIMGFYDFAGSTLVHSVGGWAALVGIYLLGARTGKFDENGKPRVLPASNIPIAASGVLILWLGWFGFNGGSVLSADPSLTSLTLVTTCLAAAAGGITSAISANILYKKYDLTMFMNGILGGLVGITAGADQMSPTDAILIGFFAGMIIVAGISLIDKLKLDDPVGAVAVHLICGIWGTLAVGVFGEMAGFSQFIIQLKSVLIIAVFCIVTSFIIFYSIKKLIGLRVNDDDEAQGLDIAEHGMKAYE